MSQNDCPTESMVQNDCPSESPQLPPQTSTATKCRRLGSAAAAGLALGYLCVVLSKDARLRLPRTAVAAGKMDKITELPADLPRFPVAFSIPPGDKCGAASCSQGDLCCPGGPGYGYSCGTTNAVCCQGLLYCENGDPAQFSVAIVCGDGDVCCRNNQGNPYCCAQGNLCHAQVCIADDGECFPGSSQMQVLGRGSMPLAAVATTDKVLVQHASGSFAYEPVLGFVHELSAATTSFVTIAHEHGELRASEQHLIVAGGPSGFRTVAAGAVQVGDLLVKSAPFQSVSHASRVLSVWRSRDGSGMYAPLTSSGKVVVDGVVASSYALPMGHRSMSQGSVHVAWFLVRVCLKLQDLLLCTRQSVAQSFWWGFSSAYRARSVWLAVGKLL
eukprot:TRINITY_DN93169_c0_g1_i1.p1 TRINITY_DN93169_c0_g1~~TRINITY_DN93169_c0_g1_i1.p1  ORF type:complete len:440 (+),score=50.94 TRINITY_DN93169_c0_g1_i1:163-1320(+)